MDCEPFSERRYQCHAVYGKGGEECLHQELSEKRCLSLRHCPKQAKEYYGAFPLRLLDAVVDEHGSPLFLTKKALCASWAEAFAYAGGGGTTASNSTTTDNDQHEQRLIYGDAVVEHHRQAQTTVSKDPALKQDCRQVAFALAQCLRTKRLF